MQRRILGVSAIVFLLIAVAIWLWWPGMDIELAFFSRMGAVLVAAWLAYDDVQRLPGWILLTLPVVLVVLVRWPRLLLLLIPALVVWWVLQRLLSSGQR
jgi:hypothetical protein